MKSLPVSLLLLLTLATDLRAAGAREVLSSGGEKRYWVAEVIPPGTRGVQSALTELRMRDTTASTGWRRVAVLTGRAVSIAARDGDAAVVFDDQSWLLVWPGGSTTGPQLPDGLVLRALTADQQSTWVLAVKPSPATQPNVETPAGAESGLELLQLDRGEWSSVATVPPTVRNDQPLSLGMFEGRPMIAWQTGPRELSFTRYRRSGDWQETETIRFDFAVDRFQLLNGAPSPSIWAAAGASAGVVRVRGESWGEPAPLQADARISPFTDVTADYFAGNVRLLVKREGRLIEQPFALDGAAAGKSIDLGRLPVNQQPVSIWSILMMALLAVLLSSAVFRSDGEAETSSPADALQLAPFARRLVAGLIDLLPMVGVVLWRLSQLDADSRSAPLGDEVTVIYLLAAGASYLLYTIAAELIAGRTVGKIACGLRVVSTDGSKPGKLALLVRNVIRVIDVLPGSPLLLLIFFSPLRQRLGDVVARTIVVLEQPREADKPAENKDADETRQ